VKKGRRPPDAAAALPVDPDRLRGRFPDLTEDDVAAYAEVTRRILEERDPAARARVTRETLARARAAREAGPRDDADRLALRYLSAVEKMQGRAAK
jgi:hypothetical protein